MSSASHPTIITGVCPHDCPDTCAWQVTVDPANGRAIRIQGHPRHPVTQGWLCGKVDYYLERTYHPDRLTTPLKRVGPKGAGRFQPIGWDQAMREITARLRDIIAEFGPEAVMPYSYAGTMGVLQGEGMASRFFNRLGATRLARTICSEAGFEGFQYVTGRVMGPAPEDFAHAELILIWGNNTLTSNMHLWPFIQKARKGGAPVIVIDPARTRTARAADEWIPIRPGTDGALALAMMHVILAEDRVDREYVRAHTTGFEALAHRVRDFSPAWAERMTGISAGRIVRLAREYAEARPAAVRINYGLQRHAAGGMAVRNIATLPALVGHWRYRGGGVLLSASGAFHLDKSGLERPDLLGNRQPRTLNMIRLGDALSLDPARRARAHYAPRPIDRKPAAEDAGPPVKALIVYNSNPGAVAPDQTAVHAGLTREDLLTIVLEHFQTDTADFADYLLPATTQLEHWDILKPYGHLYLALNQPAIAPRGESLPNSEIFRRLARGLGFSDDAFTQDDVSILRAFIEAQTHPTMAGITWERLLAEGFVHLTLPDPFLPFAQGFPTPDGKCQLFSQQMADDGYDPLPAWTPPRALAALPSRSLVLISPPAHNFLNTTFANLERFRQREGEPLVWVHPHDAVPRGIGDGDGVILENNHGRVQLTARVTTDVMPGALLAPTIWWAKLSPDGRNVNWLVPQDETDMGGSPTFYDIRVTIQPAASHD
ncbi:MAG TPA: molybdopterin oxidoreductase family protein [Caldilineae bacterium]|nr:molybdopterin oxidoreductase family protein [Caldilineae bacterium]